MYRLRDFTRAARCAALFSCVGCSTSHVDGPSPRASAPEHRDPPAAAAAAPASPRAEVGAQPKAQGGRVVYDLLAHLEHAEQRVDGHLFADFGGPGDAKYTLGGWGTRMGARALVDGTSAALVDGNYGDVAFALEPGMVTPHLHVRVRAPRDGDVTLYVDDKELLHTKADKSAFGIVSVALPASLATPGEHMLRVRGTGMAPLAKHSTGVALDWLAISDHAEPLSPPAPVSASLEPGSSLGFYVPVGEGESLVLRTRGAAEARLALAVVRDDGSRTALPDVAPGASDARFDLAPYAGEVVRVELTAEGPLTLDRAAIVVPGAAAPAALTVPKNVLVYLIDTLRADHLKPFNPRTRVSAPGLDALVAQGSAVFASAHTQENWTKPSVATLLSSLYPWDHHAVTTEAVVPEAVLLLPERLEGLGFYRGAFIANGYVSDKFGFKQGWSTYRNYIREGRYSRAEFLAADVVEWLDKRPAEKPFFLYVHAIDPHVPYKPTAKFLSLYDPNPYSGIVDFSKDGELLEKIKTGKLTINARDKLHLEALYDSEISYHDVHFHAVLEALDKRALSDDTMIVVVADHGEEFWDHGSVGHGHSVYEELIRIPMVIRVPGLGRPRLVQSSSGLVDIVPTIFDALGKERPPGLRGRSLMPELTGADRGTPPVSVAGFMDGIRTVVVGSHKLIQRSEKRFSVYDLARDPGERTDVARERPISTRFLRAQLGFALGVGALGERDGKKPKALKRETTRIDKETEAQLRALGYVGTSRR